MILQKFGALLVDVDASRPARTSVETPYLVSLVKGTRFEVEVTLRGTEVRVERGMVEASGLGAATRASALGERHVRCTSLAPWIVAGPR